METQWRKFFEDSFAHPAHCASLLQKVVNWNGFSTVMKEFSEVPSLCGPTCPKSFQIYLKKDQK